MNAIVEDLKFPEIVDPADAASAPPAEIAAEVVDKAEFKGGQPLVAYSRTEAALADLNKRFKGAKFDLTTTKGDKAARSARLELVTLRTDLEKKRKAFKAPALEFGKKIDAEAARITAEIESLAKPIDAQIKADEERRERERQERERVEAARVKVHRDAIASVRAYVDMAKGLPSDRIQKGIDKLQAMVFGAETEEFTDQYTAAKNETVTALIALHADTKAREDEAARLEAQRAEQARIAAEQAEQARKLAEAQAEIERQRAELEAQQRAAAAAAAAPATDTSAAATMGTEVTPGSSQPEASPATVEAEPDPLTPAEVHAKRWDDAARLTTETILAAASPAQRTPAEAASRILAARLPEVARRDEPATLKLGVICERLGDGITMTAAFVADTLGVQHSATDKAAKLYTERQFAEICRALVSHVGAMAELYAAT